ncbi:MAG: hypothetical protein RLZZ216_2438 [Cyanobacteriota bacterium]
MGASSLSPVHPRVLIAGGGTGGVTIASWLRRLDPGLEITLVEPSTSHHYQSGWVLVAGGFLRASATSRPEAAVLPDGVHWIHNRVRRFLPECNAVELLTGERLEYDVLIVALGLQLRWTDIPGLVETLGKNGVTSIYSRRFAQSTRQIFSEFAGGLAIFTEPETAIKCGGAPQKIMHLAHDQFSKRSVVGVKTNTMFCTAKSQLFPIPAYAKRMAAIAAEHGSDIRLHHRLIAVDGPAHEAVFAVDTEAGSSEHLSLHFDLLHVVPPMGAPDVVATSALATEGSHGYVDVDPFTGRHNRLSNVFAIGDVGSFPTAKTAAAIRKQAPVIAAQVIAQLRGSSSELRYDGYSACPLITSDHTVMLMEFDYSREPVSSFLVNPVRERWSQWLLERFGFPWIYWNRMLRGLPHEGAYIKPLAPLARALGLMRWQHNDTSHEVAASVGAASLVRSSSPAPAQRAGDGRVGSPFPHQRPTAHTHQPNPGSATREL